MTNFGMKRTHLQFKVMYYDFLKLGHSCQQNIESKSIYTSMLHVPLKDPENRLSIFSRFKTKPNGSAREMGQGLPTPLA